VELKRLIEICRRRWLVVAVVFVVTTTLVVLSAVSKPARYESSGSFVVRPRAGKTEVQAFDTLIRGVEINATYAAIARSAIVRERAKAKLGPGPWDGIRVSAENVTGTNTLKIGATGPDPVRAQQLAAAVGAETKAYVDQLGEAFQLVPLDPPDVPRKPVDTKQNLTIALGAVLGLACGIGLGAVIDGLRDNAKGPKNRKPSGTAAGPLPNAEASSPLLAPSAEASFAAYDGAAEAGHVDASMLDGALVSPRIREDVARAARKGQSFSLGILRFENAHGEAKNGVADHGDAPVSTVDRRRNGSDPHVNLSAADLMRFWRSRERGALTHIGDETFAVVLPGVSAAAAGRMLADWFAVASTNSRDARPSRSALQVSIGVREYHGCAPVGKQTATSPEPA
jgi:capsular polysaccharide biosynthesis protein